jgi:two-component system CheB/CheR fusion protein
MTGEPVFLPAELATPFGLVFHELATNAAKYGSFSRRAGTVDMEWSLQRSNGQPILTVVWRELGGPKTTEPKTRGFGSKLIEKAIPNALARREFTSRGVICTIEVPLPKAPDAGL